MTGREQRTLALITENPMITQNELAERLGVTRVAAAGYVSGLTRKGYILGRGYVLKQSSYAMVIGGANMDIGAQSTGPLVPGDSNPGRVTMTPGGVARNIAHNLQLLGANPKLMTALGNDFYGKQLAISCQDLGIDIKSSLWSPCSATSTYLYISDPAGNMVMAVSDMDICQELTPEYIHRNIPIVNGADALVVDTNLSHESLYQIMTMAAVPIFCDPVSTAKAEKLRDLLPYLHTLKPNKLEAELLTGISIHTDQDLKDAATKLLKKGVQQVFITLGDQGVYAATADKQIKLPNLPCTLTGATGCGDAFMAALVWAYMEGLDLEETAMAGLAAAAITTEATETVNPGLSRKMMLRRMGKDAPDLAQEDAD